MSSPINYEDGVKMDSHPGPILQRCAGFNMHTDDGFNVVVGNIAASQATLALDPLPVNGVTLTFGPDPLGAKLNMSATGITLSIGGPMGVVLSLALLPTPSATLSVGGAGLGPTLKLDPTSGAQMSFTPAASVAVSPAQGLAIMAPMMGVTVPGTMTVTAGTLTETVAMTATRTAAATQTFM